MFTIHEKRLRRRRKALAHKRSLAMPQQPIKAFTFRAGDHTPKPKRSFFQKVASFFRGVFKGGRA